MVCLDKKWTLFPACELWFMSPSSPPPRPSPLLSPNHPTYTLTTHSKNCVVHHIALPTTSGFLCVHVSHHFYIRVLQKHPSGRSREREVAIHNMSSCVWLKKKKNLQHKYIYIRNHPLEFCLAAISWPTLTSGDVVDHWFSVWSFCPSIPSWVTGRQKRRGHMTHS